MNELKHEIIQGVLDHRPAKAVIRQHSLSVQHKELVVLLVTQGAVKASSGDMQKFEGLLGVDDHVVPHFRSFNAVDGFGKLLAIGVMQQLGMGQHCGGQLLDFLELLEDFIFYLTQPKQISQHK